MTNYPNGFDDNTTLPPLTPGETQSLPSGAAQGSILYFNGTSWVALPPGTNGQFLKTQGASANPLWATVSGGGGSTSLVASAGGQVTGDGSSYDITGLLYTVPTGKAGLYRATMFTGPATTNGFGQVHVRVDPWGEYPPGTGNLQFMSPKNSDEGTPGINPVLPTVQFLIGEGSTIDPPQVFTWWAAEGIEIDYIVQVNGYDAGDFVWMTSLEYLGPN